MPKFQVIRMIPQVCRRQGGGRIMNVANVPPLTFFSGDAEMRNTCIGCETNNKSSILGMLGQNRTPPSNSLCSCSCRVKRRLKPMEFFPKKNARLTYLCVLPAAGVLLVLKLLIMNLLRGPVIRP